MSVRSKGYLAKAAASATETGKNSALNAYQGLKNLFKKKFGPDSKVVEAVGKLEEDADSACWKESLGKAADGSAAIVNVYRLN